MYVFLLTYCRKTREWNYWEIDSESSSEMLGVLINQQPHEMQVYIVH